MEQKKYGKNLNIIKKVEIADMNMDKQTIHGVISLPRRQMIALVYEHHGAAISERK